MDVRRSGAWILETEARSLLTRLDRLRPFSLTMPAVAAAAVSPQAQSAMENHMNKGRQKLRHMVQSFLHWLRSPAGDSYPLDQVQQKLAFLRLRFNAVISQSYIFSDVLTQRSSYESGVWVAGLDDVAADALDLPGNYYDLPPVVCYLDRGHGGAIRRVRTRLPGGELSPVAIIRIPQERMIGSGIASSLVHETGHQAVELLGLITSLRPLLRAKSSASWNAIAFNFWEKWISEILADFWGVGKVGIASTLGLISLVSLPRIFVYRIEPEDPHPSPFIRVKLSCALGDALYPHPQWRALAQVWDSFYPLHQANPVTRRTLALLQDGIPEFVTLLLNHRPFTLRGKSLREVMPLSERQPASLALYYQDWKSAPEKMKSVSPTLAFAAIGQARADGKITPEQESETLAGLLTHWAMQSALETSSLCASQHAHRKYLKAQPSLIN
jgi:hypothetical protein